MATALPRPQADLRPLRGLLFAGWAVIVLAAYFSYHPLPMRDGVPLWKGLLTVVGMLAISWPLWRTAAVSRGLQVEHLLLLPILLNAALVMLPLNPALPALGLWLLWVFAAYGLRRRFGTTGLLMALLVWFPGRFAAATETQTAITSLAIVLLLAILLPLSRQPASEPHRYVRRTAVVALTIGILLSLADLQRRYHPVGYLTGIVDETTWLSQNTVPAAAPEAGKRENRP